MNECIKRFQFGAAFSVLLVAFAGLQGCKHAETDVTPVVTVQAAHPEQGEITEHVSADATLSAVAQAAITPKITAPVKQFYVQRGSKVKAGTLLAVLENRDLSAAALDSKGQYVASQAAYDMETKALVPEDYKKAQLDDAQALSQLELQRSIVAARKKLFEQGAIPGRDYDTAQAALVQTQAAYDVAHNHLQSFTTVSHGASMRQAQGLLSSAKGKYLAAEAQMSYSEIRSPIAGVVTDRPLYAGETAVAGTPLITVMDTSSLIARVHLSQSVAQRLHVGDRALVMVPGVDDPVEAVVSLISPALDPSSTTIEVWLKIANPKGVYKAGTPVRASISGRTVTHALKVPLSAILTAADGSKFVMTVSQDGTAHQRAVTLGIHDEDFVQVVSGVDRNANVITEGAYGLDEGTKVQIGKPDGEQK